MVDAPLTRIHLLLVGCTEASKKTKCAATSCTLELTGHACAEGAGDMAKGENLRPNLLRCSLHAQISQERERQFLQSVRLGLSEVRACLYIPADASCSHATDIIAGTTG